MSSVRMMVLAGAVLICTAGVVAGDPPEPGWQPPANAQEILRYKVEGEINSRLKDKVREAKSSFEKNVTDLGKKLYDSGVTAQELQRLVDEVIKRKGTKNPTVDYQEDLKAVVEAAANSLLDQKNLGNMRDYVQEDLIRRMMIEVAVKGMDEIAHLATLGDMDKEEVINTAHKKARERYHDEIESARRSKKKIEDPDGLWKKIQKEEFEKAAKDWMFKTLHKNWGAGLPSWDSKYKDVEKGIGRRVGQLPGLEEDLAGYIQEEIQDIIRNIAAETPAGRNRDREIKKQVKDLFDRIKEGAVDISSKEQTKMLADAKEKMGLGKDSNEDEQEQPQPSGTANRPTWPGQTPPSGPTTPVVNSGSNGASTQGGASRSGQQGSSGSGSGNTPQNSPGRTAPKVDPYPCQFLIDLQMKDRDSSVAVITVHLCKSAGPQAGIERQGVMPTKEIQVGSYTERSIEVAATAIQKVLESQDGLNLCVDQAQALAMRSLSANQVPPVLLNCHLRKGRVFGQIWSDAIQKGVENTATNVNWKTVTIKFQGTLSTQ